MNETLTCPSCGHTISSARTHSVEDSRVVGCNKCKAKSSLGDWRLTISDGPPALPPQQPSAADVPPPEIGHKSFPVSIGKTSKSGDEDPVGAVSDGVAGKASDNQKSVNEAVAQKVLVGCLVMFLVMFALCAGCIFLAEPITPERQREIRDEALRYEIEDENARVIQELDRAIRKEELRRGG
jgi:hypothetical protein